MQTLDIYLCKILKLEGKHPDNEKHWGDVHCVEVVSLPVVGPNSITSEMQRSETIRETSGGTHVVPRHKNKKKCESLSLEREKHHINQKSPTNCYSLQGATPIKE